MMKANELRIGNLVVEKGRSPFAIGIEKICDFANGFYKFEPIELTGEWLIKLGFKSDGIEWFDGVICLGIFKDGLYYLPTGEINYIVGKEFKYVHQLQNLYYAITGTDYLLEL